MSSKNDVIQQFGGDSSEELVPSHNPPWPYTDTFVQAKMEKKFLQPGVAISFDRLPTLQWWAPWLGFPSSFRTIAVIRKVMEHAIRAGRPLAGHEAEAISEHAANSVRMLAYAQPVTLMLAAGFAWAGRKTLKFPFYKPNLKKIKPYVFPHKSMPLLRGTSAVVAWHALRFAAYAPLTFFASSLFFYSMADSGFQAHVLRDRRTSSLVYEIARNAQTIRQRAVQEQRQRRGIPDRPGQTRNPVSESTSPMAQSQQVPEGYGDENASQSQPSFGQYVRGSGTGSAGPSEQYPQWGRDVPSPSPSSPSKPQDRWGQSSGSQTRNDDENLFDDDDDASPVSASARRAEAQQAQRSTGGSSSWERVRQQARPDAVRWDQGDSSGHDRGWASLRQDKTRNAQDRSPKTEQYAYTREEEEREKRNYEKEQAQKDFDALLESERKGESSDRGWRGSK
ncbi:hypothetical protein F4778DRAFT_758202 [Xylariomycetidae sp. FL2044]|nr:hypothetical protein F4778DRAFT_758202 [Xylariomycetidae sp. FL2044]